MSNAAEARPSAGRAAGAPAAESRRPAPAVGFDEPSRLRRRSSRGDPGIGRREQLPSPAGGAANRTRVTRLREGRLSFVDLPWALPSSGPTASRTRGLGGVIIAIRGLMGVRPRGIS